MAQLFAALKDERQKLASLVCALLPPSGTLRIEVFIDLIQASVALHWGGRLECGARLLSSPRPTLGSIVPAQLLIIRPLSPIRLHLTFTTANSKTLGNSLLRENVASEFVVSVPHVLQSRFLHTASLLGFDTIPGMVRTEVGQP